MGGYLLNFIVYTAAMIGVIFLAVVVYKKMYYTGSAQSNFLNVEESLNIAPRKKLYVVRAGNERFLIAADAERTSLISKLEEGQTVGMPNNQSSVDDLPVIVDFPQKRMKGKNTQQVLKNIVHNI